MNIPYDPVKAVVAMHNTPRFGYSNDVSVLITNQFDTSIDYYLGFSYIVSIIGFIFFVWLGILLLLRILDWRVGCASGRPFQMNDPNDLEPVAQRIVKTRISFLFFGLILIGSSLSLIFNVTRAFKTVHAVNSSAEEFISAISQPTDHSQNILDIIDVSIPEREEFLDSLSSFCPVVMKNSAVYASSLSIADSFNSLGDFYRPEIDLLTKGLNSVMSFIDTTFVVKSSAEVLGPWQSAMLGLYICLITIVFALICGVVMAGMPNDSYLYDKFSILQTWFLYPAFFLLIVCSWIGTCGVAVSAIMTSDFCYGGTDTPGGPAQTIINMVQALESVEKSNMAYDSMTYITNGCLTENPLRFLNDYENKIQRTKAANIDFISTITQPSFEILGQACVKGQSEVLQMSVLLGSNLDIIMGNIKDLKMNLSCDLINPIWNDGIEELICMEGANALMWTFYSFLVVSICGMSLFSLRSARNDVEVTFSEEGDEFDESWKNDARRSITPPSFSGKTSPYRHDPKGRSYYDLEETDGYTYDEESYDDPYNEGYM